MLHRIKGIFGADHIPVVSFTIKTKKILISLIIGSSEAGFRSRYERKQAEKM
jgi:hypothetical protein